MKRDSTNKQIRHIRVFGGGKDRVQVVAFKFVINNFILKYPEAEIIVEYLFVSEIRDLGMAPGSLIDWLLDSDFHIFLSHPHQGISIQYFNCSELLSHLLRLEMHPGFPSGNNLRCPIFTQDKLFYIQALRDFTIPTFALETPNYEDYPAHKQLALHGMK